MSKLLTLAASAAAFGARYPNAGVIDSAPVALQASEDATIDVQAAAFRGYTTGDKTVYVKAQTHFFVAGDVVSKGDVIEVTESEARYLKSCNKAVRATDEEVGAAKKGK
jgi:hypothetical protein